MKRRGVLFKHVDHPPRGDIEGAACKVVEAINKADDKKTQEEELLILCGAATVHVKKNKTKNDTLIFFMASLVISLLTHKIAHVLLDNSNGGLLNLTSMERYLWVPSIFLSDIYFIAAAYFILSCTLTGIQKNTAKMVVWQVAGGVLCALTFLISSVEIQSLLSFKEVFPWNLMFDFMKQWENSKAMAKEASKQEGFVPIGTVWCLQILLTAALFKALKTKVGWKASSSSWSIKLNSSSWSIKLNFKTKLFIVAMLLNLKIQVWVYRPGIPYDHFSHTPFESVIRDLAPSFLALWDEEEKMATVNDTVLVGDDLWSAVQPIKHDSSSSLSSSKDNINVVILILESTRADLMPYDNSTAWAEYHKLDKVSTKEVTPFFDNLVNDEYSFHIPHIKGGSGITIKALFNIFCSMHSLPTKLTQEHQSKFYHQCLPEVLKRSGYSHQLFSQSSKFIFDHENEVIAKSGFNATYTFESYLKEYDLAEYNAPINETMFVNSHKTNPVTLEDDLFLDPVLRWVDETKAKHYNVTDGEPFFLSYLTGVTHWPYTNAPGTDWEHKSFVGKKGFNNLLNTVAYEDRFISKVFAEFEKRNLMNSTLFVIAGDHGCNFKNRNSVMTTANQYHEEMFDVGVTFHTQNEELTKEISKLSDRVYNKTWATIDLMPTILDLLGLQGSYRADGWSMMNPLRAGPRMTYSTSNPGSRMILRDGDFVIVAPNIEEKARNTLAEVSDLSKDPFQTNPIFLDQAEIVDKKTSDTIDDSAKHLVHWGVKARKFLENVETDLLEAHRIGQRCYRNCSLSLLDSLESIEDWDGFDE